LKVAIGKEGYLLIRKKSHPWLLFFRVENSAPYPYVLGGKATSLIVFFFEVILFSLCY
jgi:hypothetical protein